MKTIVQWIVVCVLLFAAQSAGAQNVTLQINGVGVVPGTTQTFQMSPNSSSLSIPVSAGVGGLNGLPIANGTVNFIGSTSGFNPQTAVTSDAGIANTTFVANGPETVTISACLTGTIVIGTGPRPCSGTVTLTITAAPAPVLTRVVLAAPPATLQASGTTASLSLTATALDQNGHGMSGISILYPISSVPSLGPVTTNGNGIATAAGTLVPGVYDVSASAQNGAIASSHFTVTVAPDPALLAQQAAQNAANLAAQQAAQRAATAILNATVSLVAPASLTLDAGNSANATITAQVLEGDGTPLPGINLTFSAAGGSASLSTPAPTDSSGNTSMILSVSSPEVLTVKACFTNPISGGQTCGVASNSITVKASIQPITLTAFPPSVAVPSGGSATTQVCALSTPAAGPVNFNATGGTIDTGNQFSGTLASGSLQTCANLNGIGLSGASVTACTGGGGSLTACSGALNIAASAAQPAAAGTIALSATPSSLLLISPSAVGSSQVCATVSTPFAGQTVTFTTSLGGAASTKTTVKENASGVACTQLNSIGAAGASVTASALGVLGLTWTPQSIAIAATVAPPSGFTITLNANPSGTIQVPAGAPGPTITFTGQVTPPQLQQVNLNQAIVGAPTGGMITGLAVDGTGKFTFTSLPIAAGTSFTIAACPITTPLTSLASAGCSNIIPINVVLAAPTLKSIVLTATTPATIPATGTTTSVTFTAKAADAIGNPIAAAGLVFTAAGAGAPALTAVAGQTGTYTASAAFAPGTYAVAAAGGGVTSNAVSITVTKAAAPPPPAPTLKAIALSATAPAAISATGTTTSVTFTAMATDTNGNPIAVSGLAFTAAGTGAPALTTVAGQTGTYTASAAFASGTYSITAAGGGVTSNAVSITVTKAAAPPPPTPTLKSIVLSATTPATISATGTTTSVTFTAKATDTNGNPIAASGLKFTDTGTGAPTLTAVAGQTGTYTASASFAPGTYSVTATGGGITSNSVSVTVTKASSTGGSGSTGSSSGGSSSAAASSVYITAPGTVSAGTRLSVVVGVLTSDGAGGTKAFGGALVQVSVSAGVGTINSSTSPRTPLTFKTDGTTGKTTVTFSSSQKGSAHIHACARDASGNFTVCRGHTLSVN